MNERDFWIEMRRGLRTTIAAIDHGQSQSDEFWQEVRHGLVITARAIEYRYRLPVGSRAPIGTQTLEPPATPLAQSTERIG